ncbi:hypothetical protein ACVWYI_005905 [Bradyrhizobium sp. LB13.1]
MPPSAYQVADWNGQSGERWVAHQARLDARLAVLGQAAIEAAAPATGERVLDAGPVPGSRRQQRRAARGRVRHPVLAFRSDVLRRSDRGVRAYAPPALRPGGRVAFVCWRGATENDWMRLPMGAIKGIVPPTAPPDPEAPGPFSFGDRGRVGRILTAAGFTNIAIAPFDASVPFGEGATRDAAIDDAVKMTLEVGPLSRALADQPDDIRARASAAVRAAFAGRPGERSVMIDSATWIVTARNPAS